jgi:hypothetical protein
VIVGCIVRSWTVEAFFHLPTITTGNYQAAARGAARLTFPAGHD